MSKEPDLSAPRRGPRPAADEGIDSAEVPAARRPVGRPKKEKAEPVIQFSTRLGLSFRDTIDSVEEETGQSIRSIIEEAIRMTYPDHYRKHSAR
ncbi:hypothetical protein [Rhodococcus opacus]|uniref:hypothetical protein n=1 Tax=Rhodococcus opacus TaxID=37919 RepID=UPI002476550F|nr:hypothetical protein [Rhodococcus opacus]MDH6291866.1 hypothetical protein [Rhodococcus opacus]